MDTLNFSEWYQDNNSPKVGKVKDIRVGDNANIIRLDKAIRLLARLDPLYTLSPEMRAYARSKPWKSSLGK
jgi:hypothetical protein